jgi:hypothetical protein
MHALEGAVEILDDNIQIFPVQCDAAGERLANDLVGDGHIGDEHYFSVVLFSSASDCHCTAERHEFGILFDIGDKIEHVRGGVTNAALRRKFRHRLSGRGACGLEAYEILAGVMR